MGRHGPRWGPEMAVKRHASRAAGMVPANAGADNVCTPLHVNRTLPVVTICTLLGERPQTTGATRERAHGDANARRHREQPVRCPLSDAPAAPLVKHEKVEEGKRRESDFAWLRSESGGQQLSQARFPGEADVAEARAGPVVFGSGNLR